MKTSQEATATIKEKDDGDLNQNGKIGYILKLKPIGFTDDYMCHEGKRKFKENSKVST